MSNPTYLPTAKAGGFPWVRVMRFRSQHDQIATITEEIKVLRERRRWLRRLIRTGNKSMDRAESERETR